MWSVVLLLACRTPAPPTATGIEVSAFQRMRASAKEGAQVLFTWTGEIHELRPGVANPSREPLFTFQGYNIGRTVPSEDGQTQLLSREVTLYLDGDGEILDCWVDPAAGSGVGHVVHHVQNDGVNFTLTDRPPRIVDDRAIWTLTLPVSYPSPLSVEELPDHASGELYQSLEMFTFEAALADVQDTAQDSVPARLSWSRVGPWLPWMGRGQTPGWLVYHGTGNKLPGGFEELPDSLRSWVQEHAPALASAPTSAAGPK